jgi:bis(5'-nucleosidyl)-tetraphosphatase
MAERTLSAGVVIVRQAADGWRVLLLRAYNYWDFPKGETQLGEDPLTTAKREVREETTIEDLEFRWGQTFFETPPYGRNKVARYYLAVTGAEQVHLPVNADLGRPEHQEYRWLEFAGARPLVVPRVAAVLDWAQGQLNR